jgi:hypothetical protein
MINSVCFGKFGPIQVFQHNSPKDANVDNMCAKISLETVQCAVHTWREREKK